MQSYFFKKEVPKTPIYMPNGDALQFEPRNERVGFYQTANESEVKALKKLEADHRGGVTSITQAEFDSGKKKAGLSPSNPGWREEIGKGVAQDTMQKRAPGESPQAGAVAAVKPAPLPPSPPATAAAVKDSVTLPPVKPPNVGRRP